MESEDFKNAMISVQKYERRRALKACFQKSSWDYELTDYNRFIRCWIWLKTLLCILFNRTGGSYLNTGSCCVLSYDSWSGYENQNWSAVWVNSPKFFTGWQVHIGSDGT